MEVSDGSSSLLTTSMEQSIGAPASVGKHNPPASQGGILPQGQSILPIHGPMLATFVENGLGGLGGVIVLDREGRYSLSFSTAGMYRGRADADGREVAIFAGE